MQVSPQKNGFIWVKDYAFDPLVKVLYPQFFIDFKHFLTMAVEALTGYTDNNMW